MKATYSTNATRTTPAVVPFPQTALEPFTHAIVEFEGAVRAAAAAWAARDSGEFDGADPIDLEVRVDAARDEIVQEAVSLAREFVMHLRKHRIAAIDATHHKPNK